MKTLSDTPGMRQAYHAGHFQHTSAEVEEGTYVSGAWKKMKVSAMNPFRQIL